MRDIFEEAHGKWSSLLPMFGMPSSALSGRNGPCPICGGKDRFRYSDYRQRGDWICSQCGAGNGMDMVMALTGVGWMDALARVRETVGSATESKPRPRMSAEKARALCIELWKESMAIRDGDDASRYLTSRGLNPPFGHQLRYHPRVPVKGHPDRDHLPAMLARVADNSGAGVNIHRTYLERGQKAKWIDEHGTEVSAKKMMPGAIPQDAAIRLFPHEGELGVAEGIETALAVHRDFAIPCWSLISSSQMAKWTPPKGVKHLHIFADNDEKFGGQAAAYALAHKVSVIKDAPKVTVHVPENAGQDWAD